VGGGEPQGGARARATRREGSPALGGPETGPGGGSGGPGGAAAPFPAATGPPALFSGAGGDSTAGGGRTQRGAKKGGASERGGLVGLGGSRRKKGGAWEGGGERAGGRRGGGGVETRPAGGAPAHSLGNFCFRGGGAVFCGGRGTWGASGRHFRGAGRRARRGWPRGGPPRPKSKTKAGGAGRGGRNQRGGAPPPGRVDGGGGGGQAGRHRRGGEPDGVPHGPGPPGGAKRIAGQGRE